MTNPKASLALVRSVCRARGFTLRRSLGRYYVYDRRAQAYVQEWTDTGPFPEWRAFRAYTLQSVYNFVIEFPTEQFHP